jgi:hypothetical protein
MPIARAGSFSHSWPELFQNLFAIAPGRLAIAEHRLGLAKQTIEPFQIANQFVKAQAELVIVFAVAPMDKLQNGSNIVLTEAGLNKLIPAPLAEGEGKLAPGQGTEDGVQWFKVRLHELGGLSGAHR